MGCRTARYRSKRRILRSSWDTGISSTDLPIIRARVNSRPLYTEAQQQSPKQCGDIASSTGWYCLCTLQGKGAKPVLTNFPLLLGFILKLNFCWSAVASTPTPRAHISPPIMSEAHRPRHKNKVSDKHSRVQQSSDSGASALLHEAYQIEFLDKRTKPTFVAFCAIKNCDRQQGHINPDCLQAPVY